MTSEPEYVLGTHDEEIARLALQHRVWRNQVLDAWRRAGFARSQTLLDIGSGPGNATMDLADVVGSEGRVLALDKSRRFIEVVQRRAAERGLTNVSVHEIDLDREELPAFMAQGAWCRWVMSFMTDPRGFLARLRARLAPGSAFVIHEYFDYATWRTAPPSPEISEFVQGIVRMWRDSGGEPDLGLSLPRWLDELGFDVREVRPIVEVTMPGEAKWQWLGAFFESGGRRMESLGVITPEHSRTIAAAVAALSADARTRMITPGLFEIIAVRR